MAGDKETLKGLVSWFCEINSIVN